MSHALEVVAVCSFRVFGDELFHVLGELLHLLVLLAVVVADCELTDEQCLNEVGDDRIGNSQYDEEVVVVRFARTLYVTDRI